MPTIQLYKNGEKGPEHIAAEGAIDALEKVRASSIVLLSDIWVYISTKAKMM